MCQVAIVERHQVRFKERVTKAPAEKRTEAWGISADDVARYAICRVTGLVLNKEVAGVNGKHFAVKLEGDRVRRGARIHGSHVLVRGKCGRDDAIHAVDDRVWTAKEAIASVKKSGDPTRAVVKSFPVQVNSV